MGWGSRWRICFSVWDTRRECPWGGISFYGLSSTSFLSPPKNCFFVKNLLTFRILPAGCDLGFFIFFGFFGLRGGHQPGVLCD